MDWQNLRGNYPRLLLIALVGVVLLAFVIAASTSTAAFGIYNAAWDGASGMQTQADSVDTESKIALNTSIYTTANATGTVSVILSPETTYNQTETQRVRQFVEAGGTVVVAEDYGPHGNELLAGIGATASIDGQPLRDEQNTYRSPAMPVATNVTNGTLTQNVSQLTINHGTVVEAAEADVVVRSSEFSYLDTNRNAELDESETLQSYPVVTSESVGDGRVIVVSDPSLFINAMLERPGNQQFTQNLFETHNQVILDYSHAGQQPPLAIALLTIRTTPLLQVIVGTIGLGALLVWIQPPQALRRHRDDNSPTHATASNTATEAAFVAYLRKHHPEWESSRMQRIITGILDQQSEETTNE
ncbi:hypothetical protein SAMN04487948_13715 [Halogranum amylolyticum]|uniref:DUF4350 domain-containing protein n=1 Tax=Halogranum amylolyticum TaxID=660520 RepID=A0A1H8WRW0_9EURY|nr:DUF4350 domain-containing protein [Halogranum amylolyticum]SEP29818.1 hypothetical protein SAMN04487948_13715 [Halogranum amylolyticum]